MSFRILFIYGLIITLLCNCKSKTHQLSEDTKVVIQPYDAFEMEYAASVQDSFDELFRIEAEVLLPIDIPERAFTDVKSPRYRADTLIWLLRESKEYINADFVVGLIKKDISCTKYENGSSGIIKSPEYKYKDWGIFGLGYCPGKSCVVSSHRLEKGVSKEEFIARLKKVSCHELGHNLGLPHCPNKECIMQDAAETIKNIDYVKFHLCNDCRSKIGLEKN